MKRYIDSRKCRRCHRVVFQLVKDTDIFGNPIYETRTVRDYLIVKNTDRTTPQWYCKECLHKMHPNKY